MNIENLEKLILNALDELKAKDVVVMDVSELTDMTDKMIIATGSSTRQVAALANHVGAECKKVDVMPIGSEGEDTGEWALVDLGDIVVHVLLPEKREFYSLEQLWSVKR
ncbi:MAG: ribosome silencing factor [Sinobacterium sp.]|nr:ribosome silencing factor [Sinobacterium sp.]